MYSFVNCVNNKRMLSSPVILISENMHATHVIFYWKSVPPPHLCHYKYYMIQTNTTWIKIPITYACIYVIISVFQQLQSCLFYILCLVMVNISIVDQCPSLNVVAVNCKSVSGLVEDKHLVHFFHIFNSGLQLEKLFLFCESDEYNK